MKPYLYLAAPLFSDAEIAFNAQLTERLEPHFEVYLPQRDGCLVVDLVERFAIPWEEASAEVFDRDISAIRRSDLFVMLLDGRVPDEGAALELGFAYASGKTCWGLKTDPRTLLAYGMNPMLMGALEVVFDAQDSFMKSVVAWAKEFGSQSQSCAP